MNAGYESFEIWAGIAMIVLLWSAWRYSGEQRPLRFWDKLVVIIVGMTSGRGLVYLYLHPTFADFAKLFDANAILKACIGVSAVGAPLLIIVCLLERLWDKFSRKNGASSA